MTMILVRQSVNKCIAEYRR